MLKDAKAHQITIQLGVWVGLNKKGSRKNLLP